MSLLVELLSRLKKNKKAGTVSPVVEYISSRKKSKKGLYLVVIACAIASVVAGFLVVYFIVNRNYPEEHRILLSKNIRTSTNIETRIGPDIIKSTNENKPQVTVTEKNKKDTVTETERGGKTSKNITKQKPEKKVEKAPTTREIKPSRASRNFAGKPEPKVKKTVSEEKHERLQTSLNYFIYSGLREEKKGHYRNAIEFFKKALQINKNHYRLMNKIAYLSIKTGDYNEAVQFARSALKVKADYVDAMINLSIALYKTGNTPEAINVLNKALQSNGDNKLLRYNLAILYEKTGKLKEAERLYRRLSAEGYYKAAIGLGRIKERMGQYQEAFEIYRSVLTRGDIDKTSQEWVKQRIRVISRELH